MISYNYYKNVIIKEELHSSQNELPQHGIITASVKRSLQILHNKSSGISGFSTAGSGSWENGGRSFLPSL